MLSHFSFNLRIKRGKAFGGPLEKRCLLLDDALFAGNRARLEGERLAEFDKSSFNL